MDVVPQTIWARTDYVIVPVILRNTPLPYLHYQRFITNGPTLIVEILKGEDGNQHGESLVSLGKIRCNAPSQSNSPLRIALAEFEIDKEGMLYVRSQSKYRLITFDSPQERNFWERWAALHADIPLEPQHIVFAGRYRLDFAHLPTKTAIELDGFTYHHDPDKFQSDRQRDRELTRAGWRVVRFASAELKTNLDQCIQEAYRIILGN